MQFPAREGGGDADVSRRLAVEGVTGDDTARLPDAWGIFLVGGVLAIAGGVTLLGEHASQSTITALFYGFMDLGLPLGIAAFGYYLTQTDLTHEDIRHVTGWFLGGIAFLWLLYLWAELTWLLGDGTLLDLRPGFVLYGNLGGVVGLIAGANRARARQNRRLVEQTAAQQDTLEFINHLLRHNLLNGLQVVGGYAALLDGHVDAEGERSLERIRIRTANMTELIDNVRVLMRTISESGGERTVVDLSARLHDEVAITRSAFPAATFETDIADGVHVEANELVGAVFENLLTNAVVHSDRDDPHVVVTLCERDGNAEIRVADDGPGIPPHLRETYLRQGEQRPDSTGDGLGLYLVDALVGAFDGSVELTGERERGTTVVVRLPLARTAGGGRHD